VSPPFIADEIQSLEDTRKLMEKDAEIISLKYQIQKLKKIVIDKTVSAS